MCEGERVQWVISTKNHMNAGKAIPNTNAQPSTIFFNVSLIEKWGSFPFALLILYSMQLKHIYLTNLTLLII